MRKNTFLAGLFFLMMTFALTLAGCDNLIIPTTPPTQTTPPTPTDPTTPATPTNPVLALPATVKPVLGHGYDITSHYAYSPDIKAAVLDLDKLLEAQRVQEDPNLRSGVFETITGKDINEYMRGITEKVSFSVKASFLKLASFSAELGENFGNERTSKAEYAFTTTTSRIVKGAYNVGNKNGLDVFFTQNFANDIVTLSPQQLISKYGTHVMLGAVLGARADYHLSVQKKEQNEITNLGAYAKAKAEAKFLGASAGASASAEVEEKYAQYFYTQETQEKTRVFGGKEEYGQHIQNKQDYEKWIESIEGREIWVDYYPNSLVPLSDLVTDKSRSDALAQAIENYCAGKEIIVVVSPPASITTGLETIRGTEVKRIKGGEPNYTHMDVVDVNKVFGINLNQLKQDGYKTVSFYIELEVKEYGNDCYQHLYLYNSQAESVSNQLANLPFDHSPGITSTDWKVIRSDVLHFENISLDKFIKNEFVIRYGTTLDDKYRNKVKEWEWDNRNLRIQLVIKK